MLVRASQFSAGLSSQLLALLGGYSSLLAGAGTSTTNKGMLDASEEQMLKSKMASTSDDEDDFDDEEDEELELEK